VIFKIKSDGTGYSKLLDFAGAVNGSTPPGSLIFDGTFLYGMTYAGGVNDSGTIFKIMPDGTGYSKLLDFSGAVNGSYPNGSLISDGTFLYGMTRNGGANDNGTVFKLNPAGMGITENNAETDFHFSPNPCSSFTTLQSDKLFKDATLNVYNSFGQQVKQVKQVNNISGQTITFHRDNLPSGLYFIRITQDCKTILADKLVIADE
jgi:uncharacterized repeat protein (TIGR03803 family)